MILWPQKIDQDIAVQAEIATCAMCKSRFYDFYHME